MSRIDFSRLRSLTARQIVEALRRDGLNWNGRGGVIGSIVTGTGGGLLCLFTVPGLLSRLAD